MKEAQLILILDFGAQYTQLIARRVREAHVYCEVVPYFTPLEELEKRRPAGIILSGGGSLIYGLDRLIERSTGIRTIVVDDAVSCAAYGAGKMLMHLDTLQDGMMNFYRKRQLKG